MIYLRTIFSAPNEIKYLKLNLRESFDHIDKFIICEFNRTHTGEPRNLIFNNYLEEFTEEERKKMIYIGADVSNEIKYSRDDYKLSHKNNHIILGYFAKQVDLNDEDIVFSVDADEIIFGQYYDEIINELNKMKWWQNKILALPIRVFFYRINYLWENNEFVAPIACKAKVYKHKYPGRWRYEGRKYNKYVGNHFSWCLTVDEMIKKLNMYVHQSEYGHFAKREILEDAIKNKKYPFDTKVDFKIKVLDIKKDKDYYPQSVYTMLSEFDGLIATE